MLLLSFHISNERYVIETSNIVEIIPVVFLKKVPGAEAMVSGMLNYHGDAIPIIDINILCNGVPVRRSLTSRIILIKYKDDKILGLLAESVTETLDIENDEFKDVGFKVSDYKFLGGIAEHNDSLLQLINVDQLLSENLEDTLFPVQLNNESMQ